MKNLKKLEKKLKIQYKMDEKLKKARTLAVFSCDDIEKVVQKAKELVQNNVGAIEIPYRENFDLKKISECIKAVRKNVPEILVAAGTVLNEDFAKKAKNAGAHLVLSPGFNEKTVKYCINNEIPVYPGVATPSEIEKGLSYGLKIFKLFPCEVLGGIEYLDALKGPFPYVEFLVSGGITKENCEKYEKCKNVCVISGSYLAK